MRSQATIIHPKAPEGWRTPRRFARFNERGQSRQRLGVRQPSGALNFTLSAAKFHL
jgi:hypothetical protein